MLCTPGPGRREDSRWFFDLGWAGVATFRAITGSLLVLGVRARTLSRCPSHGSCAALLHYINADIPPLHATLGYTADTFYSEGRRCRGKSHMSTVQLLVQEYDSSLGQNTLSVSDRRSI